MKRFLKDARLAAALRLCLFVIAVTLVIASGAGLTSPLIECAAAGRDLALTCAIVLLIVLLADHRDRYLPRLAVAAPPDPQSNSTRSFQSGTDGTGDIDSARSPVEEHACKLQPTTEDLRELTYVASHDLRAPLRAIEDLADWTLEDHREDLPDPVLRNLELIRARAARLSRLLSDLFSYASTDCTDAAMGVVDLTQLATEFGDLLAGGTGFEVTCSGANRIETMAIPVRTILMNLVTNAIKHHDRDRGQIRIDARAVLEGVEILVSDDGPGIEPAYHDKIFELFQTLRPRDDVEGSGFGLAYVRKLTHRLNGRVAVCSDPALRRGAVFSVTLPGRILGGDGAAVSRHRNGALAHAEAA